jgi:acetate kinase
MLSGFKVLTPSAFIRLYLRSIDEELVFIEEVAAILDGSYTEHMKFPYSFARPDFACH